MKKIDTQLIKNILAAYHGDMQQFEELIANARNKAINDYMNKLCDHCMQQTNECYKLECPFCTDGCDIVNIAEQLKSGVTND